VTTAVSDRLAPLRDPKTFCKLLTFEGAAFKPYDYQIDIIGEDIADPNCRLAIRKGRRIGASIATGGAIVRAAVLHPWTKYLIIGPTKEQSGFVFEYASDFIRSNDWLRSLKDVERSRVDRIILKNGSEIVKRTAGNDGSYLHGFSVNRGAVIFDEASRIPDSAITEAVLPIAYNAGLVFVSTPRYKSGYFYDVCVGDLSTDYKRYHIPSTQAQHIPPQVIERWQRHMRPSEFATMVLGEFTAGEDAVFDIEAVRNCTDNELPVWTPGAEPRGDYSENYYYALDTSRLEANRDLTVLTIGGGDPLRVVWYHVWGGPAVKNGNIDRTSDPNDIIRQIVEYRRTFPCVKMWVDITGSTDSYFYNTLLHKHVFPVEGVTFSTAMKQRLIEQLGSCFRAGKIKIPNDRELVRQLSIFAYDLRRTENGSERKIYLASDDDYVASLAMLAQAVTSECYEYNDYIEAW
jgi:hypothetical protein